MVSPRQKCFANQPNVPSGELPGVGSVFVDVGVGDIICEKYIHTYIFSIIFAIFLNILMLSVLLSAHIKRFSVSRMQDFLNNYSFKT